MIGEPLFEVRFKLPKRGTQIDAAVPSRATAGHLPRITQVLSLAVYFDELIRIGEAKDYADVARLMGLSRERVSQIVRLLCLAPDIQTEILYLPPTIIERSHLSEVQVRRVANAYSWVDQRRRWKDLTGANDQPPPQVNS